LNPRTQPTSPNEIRNLLTIVDRDLRNADVPGLDTDGIFRFLYTAALQLATILVRLREERFGGAGHHRNTLRRARELVPPELDSHAAALEHARRKRHASIYDQAGVVTQADVAALRDAIDGLKPWIAEEAEAVLKGSRGQDRT